MECSYYCRFHPFLTRIIQEGSHHLVTINSFELYTTLLCSASFISYLVFTSLYLRFSYFSLNTLMNSSRRATWHPFSSALTTIGHTLHGGVAEESSFLVGCLIFSLNFLLFQWCILCLWIIYRRFNILLLLIAKEIVKFLFLRMPSTILWFLSSLFSFLSLEISCLVCIFYNTFPNIVGHCLSSFVCDASWSPLQP